MKLLASALLAATVFSGNLRAQDSDQVIDSIRVYTAQKEKELFIHYGETNRLAKEVEAKLKQLSDANWDLTKQIVLVVSSSLGTRYFTSNFTKLSSTQINWTTAAVTVPQLINIVVSAAKASSVRRALGRLQAELAGERARLESELEFIRTMNEKLGIGRGDADDSEPTTEEGPAPTTTDSQTSTNSVSH